MKTDKPLAAEYERFAGDLQPRLNKFEMMMVRVAFWYGARATLLTMLEDDSDVADTLRTLVKEIRDFDKVSRSVVEGLHR